MKEYILCLCIHKLLFSIAYRPKTNAIESWFNQFRFDDIKEWNNILGNIFTDNINIKNKNLTSKKEIYNLYNDYKKNYKYSDEEINLIKSIDFMKKLIILIMS